jgi:hypothetical protein
MKAFLIFLLVHTVFISSIQIENFDKVTYKVGISNFTYQFYEFSSSGGRGIYFYFNFTNQENLIFNIINENNNLNSITVKSDQWTAFRISDFNSQIYTFQIINQGKSPGELIFIDSTKEINTNLDRFLFLNFSTEIFYESPPIPLIFNIDIIKEDIFLNYKQKSETSNLNFRGDYLMNIPL